MNQINLVSVSLQYIHLLVLWDLLRAWKRKRQETPGNGVQTPGKRLENPSRVGLPAIHSFISLLGPVARLETETAGNAWKRRANAWKTACKRLETACKRLEHPRKTYSYLSFSLTD
jgi:hypothetical protein